ncbi:WhiB family transcriptional regulator [Bifidobacterium sp. SO4]|uniref:WhiB family transcriptional regulator n=1 Tax=Bifidobacterium sp. SO4 TaxID=2809030 RepID=UPI001BDCBE2E|nr:WhiB family transcriptional regulator [Bifidobacterium sp. SO4]MBT1170693.1 WhiB family transcriptional regulator [Bifidobacterium sp. SO4]
MELYDLLWMQIGPDGVECRDGQMSRAAKRVCRYCPVLMECLARNMIVPVTHGIMGGMTYKERQYAMRVAVEHHVVERGRRRLELTEMRLCYLRLHAWLEAHPEIHAIVENRRRNERSRLSRGLTAGQPIRRMTRLEFSQEADGVSARRVQGREPDIDYEPSGEEEDGQG